MKKKQKKLNRIWHHYQDWEETHSNMWGSVNDRQEYLDRAIEFTGDHKVYGAWMMKVIEEWPISCEHNLTDYSQNRRAWIGHAACALAFMCPEDIVRAAWGHLTEDQQMLANDQADKAIKEWEDRQWLKLDSE